MVIKNRTVDGAGGVWSVIPSRDSILYITIMSSIPQVRSHLEYAMQACSPNLVVNSDCFEQIKRMTTLLGCRRLPYEGRLRWLDLHSLHRRRLGGNHIAVYKMISEGLDLDPSLFYQSMRPGLRGHPFKLLQPENLKKIVLFNTSRKILEQAFYSRCNRPFRQCFQTVTWLGVGGMVCLSPVISCPSLESSICFSKDLIFAAQLLY